MYTLDLHISPYALKYFLNACLGIVLLGGAIVQLFKGRW